TSMAKAIRDRGGHEPQYHLYQIVIPLSSSPTEQEYQRVQYESKKALAAARNGENMEEIAAAYSNGSMESDLGYIPESAVPLPFLPAIVAAKPGDVIGPFRSSIGMHILKVADVSDNAVTPIKTYNSAHILLKTSIIFSDEKAVAKLKSLKEDILNGRISFDEAAKAYSEDPGSAVNGGDLGYSTPDSYDPGFARGLVSLKPGQISDPVKSNFGWHLIFLKDVKVDRDSINAYKEKAHNIIFEREYSEAVASWERSLRETAYIHILDKKLLDAHVMLDQENAKVKQVATHDDRDSQTLSDNARYVN
ncbi:MAG: peptidylprolyl isomerase, partial [Succinivibrio sp.]